MYEECDKSTLSQEQLRKVVKLAGLLILLLPQLLKNYLQVNYEQDS